MNTIGQIIWKQNIYYVLNLSKKKTLLKNTILEFSQLLNKMFKSFKIIFSRLPLFHDFYKICVPV